jgi:hypothetical protein
MRRSLGLMFLLAGCGNSPHSTSNDLASSILRDLSPAPARDLALADLSSLPPDLSTAADLMATPYPAGPYGNTAGAVIPPLVWEGYADPLADAVATAKPFSSYSMNDLRLSGRPYAAVHVAEFF